jgi:hypothetical protein
MQWLKDVEQRMGVRKEELMAAELNRLREQASMGFAVITGHQSEKTTIPLGGDYRLTYRSGAADVKILINKTNFEGCPIG